MECQQLELPDVAIESHPVAIPSRILGYRIVLIKRCRHEQVLIEWSGASSSEHTWEELDWVKHLNDLEDKVRFAGVGDVTIPLDTVEAVVRLKANLANVIPTNVEWEGGAARRTTKWKLMFRLMQTIPTQQLTGRIQWTNPTRTVQSASVVPLKCLILFTTNNDVRCSGTF